MKKNLNFILNGGDFLQKSLVEDIIMIDYFLVLDFWFIEQ